jgi:transposase, IS5 family
MLGTQKYQDSFADLAINSKLPIKIQDTFLSKIDKMIDFKHIENILETLYTSTQGRPSCPPLVLFKMLLLQQYYDLSDPELELAVADRISFRKFVGLSFEDSVPDETTMVRFRQRIISGNCHDKLFQEINRQLSERNLFVRKATIIDATLVESKSKKPKKTEESTDKDATWTSKRGKAHFGFKAHLSVDSEHNLIENTELTTASVHDSKVFEQLIPEGTKSVYADKAYANKNRKHRLESKGIQNGVLDKAYRNRKLTEAQKESNKEKSIIRCSVERVIAHLKNWYGYTKVRYKGISKNNFQLKMLAISYNLKRSVAVAMG